ncbi:hypothetical protein BS47DRAFT_1336033 [Hydnum rufescens UP504]|uniref:DUF4187 domain-containing protein n=1 Tax=Hydnum rufescens UP504 TaxID=1448309 RepID=A0A9P6E2K4_9AGAM|nr:hypothetical protein BS47DRAFT_1336033 [Hydnum rufescens UP504]
MSSDEDDYLSPKFLLGGASSNGAPSSKSKTYSELRKEAQRAAEAKNAANQLKTKKLSARERVKEGLSTSLFERAHEEEALGLGQNKALGMMKKMGFKPGQSLGKTAGAASTIEDGMPSSNPPQSKDDSDTILDASTSRGPFLSMATATTTTTTTTEHRVEPIPISIWEGKKGLGLGQKKRQASEGPSSSSPFSSRPSKAPKLEEAKEKESAEAFRARTRLEYEEKRAEARLTAATRTCIALDEQRTGLKFNILWLNPLNPNTCPPELLAAFAQQLDPNDPNADTNNASPEAESNAESDDGGELDSDGPSPRRRAIQHDRRHRRHRRNPAAARLREQMRKDALEPIARRAADIGGDDVDDDALGGAIRRLTDDDDALEAGKGKKRKGKSEIETLEFSPQDVLEARIYLALPAKDRLAKMLSYLRGKYSYCFWCGTQYEDAEEMDANCPGEDEDSHD